MTEETTPEGHSDAGRFWEEHYSSRDVATGRRVNPLLVEIASNLASATALDLGCGAGGDTLWLAGAGRRVTAVDVSGTATAQVADAARERGLGDLVHAERHDLAVGFPEGRFDLVTALYLQSPFDLPRTQVLRPGPGRLVDRKGGLAPTDRLRAGRSNRRGRRPRPADPPDHLLSSTTRLTRVLNRSHRRALS